MIIIHILRTNPNHSDTLGQNYDFTMEQPLSNNYPRRTQLNGEGIFQSEGIKLNGEIKLIPN